MVAEVQQAVRYELENETLDGLDKHQFDYAIQTQEDGTSTVLAYLADKSAVDEIVRLCSEHKLTPHKITFSALTLYLVSPFHSELHFQVYICAEDDEAEIIRRMHKLAQRLDVQPDAVRETTGYLDRTNRNNALVRMRESGDYELTPFYNQLGDYVTGLPGHKFVVLDSCYDFVRFEGSAKVNEDVVNVFVKVVLGGFCRDTNSTLLVTWHPSYAGQERGDGSGWSVAWHNAPRVRDQIKRKGDGDAFELTAVKRNHGAFPQPLTLHYSDGALLPLAEFDLSEQRAELSTACIEVATAFAKRGIPITQQRRIGAAEFDMLQKKVDY
ncbi:MAG: AAA family ATPase, partial [Nitrospinae bacterium]|nr:AAA family ATPase [Nitrospinota bacterium]